MARERGGVPVVIAAAVPLLVLQVGVGSLRFLVHRKRGVRRFRKTLIRGGLSKDQAAHLAQNYHDAGSLRLILRGAASSRD